MRRWVVALAAVLALAGCSSKSTSDDPPQVRDGSPQGVVNRIIDAADHGDVPGVAALTCARLRDKVSHTAVDKLLLGNNTGTPKRGRDYTATVGTPTITGDTADVPVTLRYQNNGVTSTGRLLYRLNRENGDWLVCN
jgi:hypothetical protein